MDLKCKGQKCIYAFYWWEKLRFQFPSHFIQIVMKKKLRVSFSSLSIEESMNFSNSLLSLYLNSYEKEVTSLIFVIINWWINELLFKISESDGKCVQETCLRETKVKKSNTRAKLGNK